MEEVHKKEMVAAIRCQIERVRELCLSEDVTAEIKVHEMRKAFKRLNALLKMFPEELQIVVDSFRKPMRGIARRLTLGRESTVNLQLFERIVFEKGGLDDTQNSLLRGKLTQTKEESLQELVDEEKILVDVLQLMNLGKDNLLPLLVSTTYFVHVFDKIQATFLRSKDLHRVIAARYDAELYHELRKQMKTLWYQSEVEAPGQTEVPGTILEKLHNITDQQGDDHDWYVFLNEVSQQKYGLEAKAMMQIKEQVARIQEANLELLNQNLSDFFTLSELQYLELLRQL